MSKIEHLIENAVIALEQKKSFDEWYKEDIDMFDYVDSPPIEIWNMAVYCYYTYRPYIEWKLTEEIEKAYGYPVPSDVGR